MTLASLICKTRTILERKIYINVNVERFNLKPYFVDFISTFEQFWNCKILLTFNFVYPGTVWTYWLLREDNVVEDFIK